MRQLIEIKVSGAVQTGKSAVLASIRPLLEGRGYDVVVLDREAMHNSSRTLESASAHARPEADAVFVLTEEVRRTPHPFDAAAKPPQYCPRCGSCNRTSGYGYMGGALGHYVACSSCSTLLSKKLDEEEPT